MTLSLFPSLLAWQELAPFLMRLALGGVFIYWGVKRFRATPKTAASTAIGIVDVVGGALLVVGLWTQAIAILAAIDLVWRLIKKATERALLSEGVNYYLLLLVLAVSLIVMGAGWWGFDAAF